MGRAGGMQEVIQCDVTYMYASVGRRILSSGVALNESVLLVWIVRKDPSRANIKISAWELDTFFWGGNQVEFVIFFYIYLFVSYINSHFCLQDGNQVKSCKMNACFFIKLQLRAALSLRLLSFYADSDLVQRQAACVLTLCEMLF